MIAQFKERKPWSALALVALIALAAVTLTDPVRGQDAADDDEKKDATTAPLEDPAPPKVRSDEHDHGAATAAPDPRDPRDPVQRLRDRRAREVSPDTAARGARATTEARRAPVTDTPLEEMDARMRATFERKLPEVNFQDVPFAEVIEFLRDVTGANIFVNWRALEAIGIDRNAPVSMRMRDVTFATVLRLLLDSTAPGLLAYNTEGGVLIITASTNAQAQLAPPMMGMGMAGATAPASSSVTRVYEVRDLLGASSNEAGIDHTLRVQVSQIRAQIEQTRNDGLGPDHPKVRQLQQIEDALLGKVSDEARLTRLSELVSIVTETIGQNQPLNVRGFKTKLIVRAAPETQTEVQSLLKMLREDNTPDTTPRETNEPARR